MARNIRSQKTAILTHHYNIYAVRRDFLILRCQLQPERLNIDVLGIH